MVMKEAKGQDEDVEFQKFENIGDNIRGELIDVKPSETYGKIFTIKAAQADKPCIIVGKMDLNRKMDEVPIGCLVKIEYVKDIETTKGKKMKIFKVLYDDGQPDMTGVLAPETPTKTATA